MGFKRAAFSIVNTASSVTPSRALVVINTRTLGSIYRARAMPIRCVAGRRLNEYQLTDYRVKLQEFSYNKIIDVGYLRYFISVS